jgi:hypothetical protein
MRTFVVNVRHDEFDVYIGRAVSRAANARCRRASIFANPYKAPRDAATSEEVLELYEKHLRAMVEADPRLRQDLLDLAGKRLGCWCAPGPCHGHVLVKVIDEVVEGRL